MNTQKLNIESISLKLRDLGFTQSTLADKLSVSREAVSKWMSGESFPRPKLLLQLATILDLSFEQIALADKAGEPVVAFRKKAHTKTGDDDYSRAKEMGEMLKKIVPYLKTANLSQPSVLKNPINDYEYIQAAAKEIRDKINPSKEAISYDELITFFYDLHATLIPVLWGVKGHHENALHIYLPDSDTTWIYLNLDTNLIDFKFWMAHELGHMKTPQLRSEDGEVFSDSFAGALLFPEKYAGALYDSLGKEKNIGTVVNVIKRTAKNFEISPNTVFTQINTFAAAKRVPLLDIDQKNFYGACSNFLKEYPVVSKTLFSDKKPHPSDFIETVSSVFKTDFYGALARCVTKDKNGSGFVERVLDIPALDAREIYDFLVKAE